jgi:AcrR family transcriptional regulator
VAEEGRDLVPEDTWPDACGTGADCPERPLRRDAERNRQRILAAAAEVFTERGLDVSLDEVARRAGVGVGTVYRRFADKEELVATLFAKHIEDTAAIAERALEMPDPTEALLWFLEEWVAMMASNVGLRQLLMFATYADDRLSHARDRFAPLVRAIVARAQATGQVRADLAPTDVPFITLMLSTAAEYARYTRPEIWRRYLTLLIDGMCTRRDGTTPLPVPPLAPPEMESVMRQRANRRLPLRRFK